MLLIHRRAQQSIDKVWQERTGLPLLLLMESAAAAVADCCRNLSDPYRFTQTRILVLAGSGQNGGDAYACARLLMADGFPVICREISPLAKLPPEAAANRDALRYLGQQLGQVSSDDFHWLQDGLVVDGMFGSGFSAARGLPDAVREITGMVEEARLRGAKVIAVDLPSGLDCDSGLLAPGAVKADHTVTFVRPKIGLYASPGCFACGKIHLARIGVSDLIVSQAIKSLPESCCYLSDPQTIKQWQPPRPSDSHKGIYGRLLLLAGSFGMPGASVLAAQAALRSGIGLLHIITDNQLVPMILQSVPEALIAAVPTTEEARNTAWTTALRQADAAAVGPGLGQPEWLDAFLRNAIKQAPALLIDADALNHIAEHAEDFWQQLNKRVNEFQRSPAVITPHPGEFKRLAPDINIDDRQQAALQLARRSSCIVVLKGAATVIACPDGKVWLNPTGHDGLARGGSGDVLSGLIAGLLAQGLPPEQAAVSGVYLHGKAAELTSEMTSRRSMLPGDLPAVFADAFRSVNWVSD